MPTKSDRSLLISQLEFLLRILAADGKEDSEDFTELMDILACLMSTRCLNARQMVPKSNAMTRILFMYSENDFKQIVRMDKLSFAAIVDKCEHHPAFANHSRSPQAFVWFQLMVVFGRLGCDGYGSAIGRHARQVGKGHGILYAPLIGSCIDS